MSSFSAREGVAMFVEQFNPQPPKTGIAGSVKAEPQAQARKIPNFLKIAYRTPPTCPIRRRGWCCVLSHIFCPRYDDVAALQLTALSDPLRTLSRTAPPASRSSRGWQLAPPDLSSANPSAASFLSRRQRDTMAFLILVIGDLHIPDRALDIPAKVIADRNMLRGPRAR